MLLGFISLMLGVFQGATQKICVKENVMRHLLPCSLPSASAGSAKFTGARRLLSGGGAVDDYCQRKVFLLWFARPAGQLCLRGFSSRPFG
jgi:mlo protein